jgi:hypothetical protein
LRHLNNHWLGESEAARRVANLCGGGGRVVWRRNGRRRGRRRHWRGWVLLDRVARTHVNNRLLSEGRGWESSRCCGRWWGGCVDREWLAAQSRKRRRLYGRGCGWQEVCRRGSAI